MLLQLGIFLTVTAIIFWLLNTIHTQPTSNDVAKILGLGWSPTHEIAFRGYGQMFPITENSGILS